MKSNTLQQDIRTMQQEQCFPSKLSLSPKRPSTEQRRHHLAIVDQPEPFDILCGKDKNFTKHPGNQKFRELIETMVGPYQETFSKQGKMRLTRQIVTTMKENFNARFLRRVSIEGADFWEEITDAMARDKASHALRFAAAQKSINVRQMQMSTRIINKEFVTNQQMGRPPLNSHVRVSANAEEDELKICPVLKDVEIDAIFQRQQAIFETLCKDNSAHDTSPPTDAFQGYCCVEKKTESTSFRRDSLLNLLKEPLFEWPPDVFSAGCCETEFVSLQSIDFEGI